MTITLGDKAFLMEPTKEIQWSIDQGKNLLKPVKDQELKGKASLTLTVRPDLKKEDAKVKIQISAKVKKQEFSPAPIQFDVILPNKLTAQHIPSGNDPGSPVPGSYPSRETWIGASMQLKISLGPTNVNFSNIQIIEKDGGENPPADTEGSLSGKHKADSVWKINNRHEFDGPDYIWSIIDWDVADAPDVKYPNTFTWKCNFKTTDGGKTIGNDKKEHINAFETVEDVEQTFKMAKIRDREKSLFNTQISKFSKKDALLSGQ